MSPPPDPGARAQAAQEDKRVWEGAAKIDLHCERDVLQKVMFGGAAKILATGG